MFWSFYHDVLHNLSASTSWSNHLLWRIMIDFGQSCDRSDILVRFGTNSMAWENVFAANVTFELLGMLKLFFQRQFSLSVRKCSHGKCFKHECYTPWCRLNSEKVLTRYYRSDYVLIIITTCKREVLRIGKIKWTYREHAFSRLTKRFFTTKRKLAEIWNEYYWSLFSNLWINFYQERIHILLADSNPNNFYAQSFAQ